VIKEKNMSQEISGAGAAANLRRSGVKPLRVTAESARMSVEDLKNGGTLDLGRLATEGEAPGSLRQRGRGARGPLTGRQGRSAGLSLPARLQKLAQIKKSATDYESIFVDQLVKQMRPSPLAPHTGGETYSELAEQPFRDMLSRAGGLGLADAIIGQIARQEGLEQTLLEHPEVMGSSWKPVIPKNLGPKHGRLTMVPPGLEPQGAEQAPPETRDGSGRAGEPAEISGFRPEKGG
jgi:hypothetical protein